MGASVQIIHKGSKLPYSTLTSFEYVNPFTASPNTHIHLCQTVPDSFQLLPNLRPNRPFLPHHWISYLQPYGKLHQTVPTLPHQCPNWNNFSPSLTVIINQLTYIISNSDQLKEAAEPSSRFWGPQQRPASIDFSIHCKTHWMSSCFATCLTAKANIHSKPLPPACCQYNSALSGQFCGQCHAGGHLSREVDITYAADL